MPNDGNSNMTKPNNAAHFIFDSNHLADIKSRLYGFLVNEKGLFTRIEDLDGDIENSTGAWVLVRRTSDGINITQDSIGCFGLFLFRDSGYWAISNSFNHLLDFLKKSRRLTFNEDYACAYLSQGICVSVYGETFIREISWLDRRACVSIDLATAVLTARLRLLEEKTISVDTEEGIRILDAWHDKWAALVRMADRSWPGMIQVDISGGFDTRMALAPVLSAKIDPRHVLFSSYSKLTEDFRIASLMADAFGLPLNKAPDSKHTSSFAPIESCSEIFLNNLCFAKQRSSPPASQSFTPILLFTGYGGEVSRSYWGTLDGPGLHRKFQSKNSTIQRCTKAITQRSLENIAAVLNREHWTGSADSLNGTQYYMETRNRSHFGMAIAKSCMFHKYIQTPLLDPLFLKLRSLPGEKHQMLVVALILTRYHEKLASFPFEGGRSIPEETLRLASNLNRIFPKEISGRPTSGERKPAPAWQVMENDAKRLDAPQMPAASMPVDEQLRRAYESPRFRRLCEARFGRAVVRDMHLKASSRHPDMDKWSAVVIAKVLDDVEHGRNACADLAAFLESCRLETGDPPIGGEPKAEASPFRTLAAAFARRLRRLTPRRPLI